MVGSADARSVSAGARSSPIEPGLKRARIIRALRGNWRVSRVWVSTAAGAIECDWIRTSWDSSIEDGGLVSVTPHNMDGPGPLEFATRSRTVAVTRTLPGMIRV